MKIPYQNMEIEQIYSQLLHNPRASIAVCSAQQGEGVTSVVCALAERNLLAGYSTLVVDLNLYRPALKSLMEVHTPSDNTLVDSHKNCFNAIQLLSPPHSDVVFNGITAPSKREHTMHLRQTGVLESYIEHWLTLFDTVLIDTSPINRINAQNIPPERVAAACDGALLVVLAGQTTEPEISHAVNKLQTAQAQIIGSVFNDRDNPTLKSELLRESQRLPKFMGVLKDRIGKLITRNQLLSLEV